MGGIPQKADVVVIGGGPAGSTAANLLAKKGFEVVLLEKVKHPRPVVGESLIPHFWKYAEDLGVTEEIKKAGFIAKAGGTTVWNGVIRHIKLSSFGYEQPALHVERDEFDLILLNGAKKRGARVFEEVLVKEVLFDNGRVAGVRYVDIASRERGEVKCSFVIDGSGQAAVLANQLGFREFDRDLRFMCVWGYYDRSDYVAEDGVICPFEKRREVRPTTLVEGLADWGWAWHITMKESVSVGIVLPTDQGREFKSRANTLEERFSKAIDRVEVVSDLVQTGNLIPDSVRAIRDFASYPKQMAGDGWFLAGDAAAFVDPINSAGVVVAFFSGAMSAWAVENSLANPSREKKYTDLFALTMLRRMSLYRISALPEGVNSYPEMIPLALEAAQTDSHREQELLLVQTHVVHRPGNLVPLLERDPRLKYRETDKVIPIERFRRLDEISRSAVV